MRRRNICSLSTTGAKPACRMRVVEEITSQSQLKMKSPKPQAATFSNGTSTSPCRYLIFSQSGPLSAIISERLICIGSAGSMSRCAAMRFHRWLQRKMSPLVRL